MTTAPLLLYGMTGPAVSIQVMKHNRRADEARGQNDYCLGGRCGLPPSRGKGADIDALDVTRHITLQALPINRSFQMASKQTVRLDRNGPGPIVPAATGEVSEFPTTQKLEVQNMPSITTTRSHPQFDGDMADAYTDLLRLDQHLQADLWDGCVSFLYDDEQLDGRLERPFRLAWERLLHTDRAAISGFIAGLGWDQNSASGVSVRCRPLLDVRDASHDWPMSNGVPVPAWLDFHNRRVVISRIWMEHLSTAAIEVLVTVQLIRVFTAAAAYFSCSDDPEDMFQPMTDVECELRGLDLSMLQDEISGLEQAVKLEWSGQLSGYVDDSTLVD